MIFADFINEVFGTGCIMFFVILWTIGWALGSIGKAAGNAVKSDTAREAAKVGFWMWFFSDD